MARSKPKTIVIADEVSAEATMLELAHLGRKADQVKLDAEKHIDQVKENARMELEPIQNRQKELENALCTFATLNKDQLFSVRKSIDTPYGPYGFRKSTKLKTLPRLKMADVLNRLQELDIKEAVKVKHSVDKEAMRDWPDSRLETVGMMRVINDEFYVDITKVFDGEA